MKLTNIKRSKCLSPKQFVLAGVFTLALAGAIVVAFTAPPKATALVYAGEDAPTSKITTPVVVPRVTAPKAVAPKAVVRTSPKGAASEATSLSKSGTKLYPKATRLASRTTSVRVVKNNCPNYSWEEKRDCLKTLKQVTAQLSAQEQTKAQQIANCRKTVAIDKSIECQMKLGWKPPVGTIATINTDSAKFAAVSTQCKVTDVRCLAKTCKSAVIAGTVGGAIFGGVSGATIGEAAGPAGIVGGGILGIVAGAIIGGGAITVVCVIATTT